MLMFRHPLAVLRVRSPLGQRIVVNHMSVSNLANNHPAVSTNQPKEILAEATETTETKTPGAGAGAAETKSEKRLAYGVDTLNKRIMDFTKIKTSSLSAPALTLLSKDLNSLAQKMDDGFNRHDGWIEFLVGMFVTTCYETQETKDRMGDISPKQQELWNSKETPRTQRNHTILTNHDPPCSTTIQNSHKPATKNQIPEPKGIRRERNQTTSPMSYGNGKHHEQENPTPKPDKRKPSIRQTTNSHAR
ncbi:hypothetical protein C7212DRAFT_362374 [Tuber magnatum]|uniref:Uncharacterized protein n=1 Tax=Tuber magnatum TaxID=42249 RepID=A0A317SU79_9PEZI|nr:hypothetical protein C7212DRAFT_362374 [Tuber magnatum]